MQVAERVGRLLGQNTRAATRPSEHQAILLHRLGLRLPTCLPITNL